jgi:hypothetical protein
MLRSGTLQCFFLTSCISTLRSKPREIRGKEIGNWPAREIKPSGKNSLGNNNSGGSARQRRTPHLLFMQGGRAAREGWASGRGGRAGPCRKAGGGLAGGRTGRWPGRKCGGGPAGSPVNASCGLQLQGVSNPHYLRGLGLHPRPAVPQLPRHGHGMPLSARGFPRLALAAQRLQFW